MLTALTIDFAVALLLLLELYPPEIDPDLNLSFTAFDRVANNAISSAFAPFSNQGLWYISTDVVGSWSGTDVCNFMYPGRCWKLVPCCCWKVSVRDLVRNASEGELIPMVE